MKKFIIDIMATTGISLVMLSLFAILNGAVFLCISSVFETLMANIVIHFGLIVTGKFESKYPILDSFLDVSFIVVVLIVFGKIFYWNSSTPVWILIIMAVIIYIIGCIIGTLYVRKDIKTINELLKKKKEKNKF